MGCFSRDRGAVSALALILAIARAERQRSQYHRPYFHDFTNRK